MKTDQNLRVNSANTYQTLFKAEQSIEAYVLSKHVSTEKPIALFVEVYQNKGWSHQALRISSSSLRVERKETDIEHLGTGIRTVYQYHLWGERGSHIIDPVSLLGAKGDQQEEIITPEIFVDVGGEKPETQLEGISRKSDSPFSWYWVVTGFGGAIAGWYLLRREKLAARPPTLEEEYRNEWGVFVQQVDDPQERAIFLSSLIRRYLDARFGENIEHATPQEARRVVEQASL